jgi:demethoxyubiquinone hydroxylase (CLK1/Coq7/Cat5 family)
MIRLAAKTGSLNDACGPGGSDDDRQQDDDDSLSYDATGDDRPTEDHGLHPGERFPFHDQHGSDGEEEENGDDSHQSEPITASVLSSALIRSLPQWRMAPMPDAATHRLKLIRLLQSACSGELAAKYAYRGHWQSVSSPEERDRIRTIEQEERHHRAQVIELLRHLGANPSLAREAIFWAIGRTLGAACHFTGWFLPMYGAGKLERSNIVEYENAAIHAVACGEPQMLDCLLEMAEVEWEHERYFREKILGHRLLRFFPLWDPPPPKASIRARFEPAVLERAMA